MGDGSGPGRMAAPAAGSGGGEGRVQRHLVSATWKIPAVYPGARVRLTWGIGVGREAGVPLWAGSSPHIQACHMLGRRAGEEGEHLLNR